MRPAQVVGGIENDLGVMMYVQMWKIIEYNGYTNVQDKDALAQWYRLSLAHQTATVRLCLKPSSCHLSI
jgi:hypothetical protein